MSIKTTYQLLRVDDKELVSIILSMSADTKNRITCSDVTFDFLSSSQFKVPANELGTHKDLLSIASPLSRVFKKVTINTNYGQLRIRRHKEGHDNTDNDTPFDIVDVVAEGTDQHSHMNLAQLTSFSQSHFGQFRFIGGIQDFLKHDSTTHFEARDAALTRLETALANLAMEQSKRLSDYEDTLRRRAEDLERDYQARLQKNEEDLDLERNRLLQLDNDLKEHEKKLNLQAPKAERREVFGQLTQILNTWNDSFKVSGGTSEMRKPVARSFYLLEALFGIACTYYVISGLATAQTATTTELVLHFVRASIFLALFVSFGLYHIQWNDRWFQKHANAEFRLKELQLDIKRAHWFVELAFQWKDEFKENVPNDLAQRLTSGLFAETDSHGSGRPEFDSLAALVLGASSKWKFSPSGTEIELDKAGIKEVKTKAT